MNCKYGIEVEQQCSMFYWFPFVEKSGLNYPKTVMIPTSDDWYDVLDGKQPFPIDIEKSIRDAIEYLSGCPVFIRTDALAAKHAWEQSCYLVDINKIARQCLYIIETAYMNDVQTKGFAVREFLQLQHSFKAFYGSMPIAKEFRLFVRDGKVEHVQPYFPVTSIMRPSVDNWKELLLAMHKLDNETRSELIQQAEHLGGLIGDYWSIDFCVDVKNKWWITDMARGELSYDTRESE